MFKTNPKQRSWLHFIPAPLTLFGLLLVPNQALRFIDFFSIAVTAHFAGYPIAILFALHRYRKRLKTTHSMYFEIDLTWLEVVVYIQLVIIAIALAEGFLSSIVNSQILVGLTYVLVLVLLHCFYYLGLKHVGLFKGLKVEKLSPKPKGEYKLDASTYTEYLNALEHYVKNEKPYLDFEISLFDFSKKLKISSRNVSYVINKEFGVNFYEYINGHRLKVSKEQLLKTNKQIKEIMYDSGFSNKATFNTFFKKQTGCTPSQFRRHGEN
jgi:AraC-like DNA-binding protein